MGHSAVEHRLRTDIDRRHRLKNEIYNKQSMISKLTEKLEHTKKKRLNNRYSSTIRRLDEEIQTLRERLHEINLDLQKRIRAEMKFSEEEVESFKEQYRKELSDMMETQSKLESIEEGETESEAEAESEEESVPKEAVIARTKRILDVERKKVAGLEKEINSEERDKVTFTEELKQIMADLEEYEGSQE
jgi:uncharacterized protein YecT (DUF1311 family)